MQVLKTQHEDCLYSSFPNLFKHQICVYVINFCNVPSCKMSTKYVVDQIKTMLYVKAKNDNTEQNIKLASANPRLPQCRFIV